jgi:hypothetical protein
MSITHNNSSCYPIYDIVYIFFFVVHFIHLKAFQINIFVLEEHYILSYL